MALDEPSGMTPAGTAPAGMTPARMTLRERKRMAAREALSAAAIKLAVERGLENVRVEDIAGEVGVSTRTFNNYFSSKEEAICAITVRRNARIGELLLKRPPNEPIWDAVTNAVAEHFSAIGEPDREFIARFRLVVGNSALHGEFLKAHAEVECLLSAAIAKRTGIDAERDLGPWLLAGAISSTIRVAMRAWFSTAGTASLSATVRTAMAEISTGIPSLSAKSDNDDANHDDDRAK
jgi:AcrR family transcriptional regulator